MPLLWWFAETTLVAAFLALAAWGLGRWRRLDLGPGARHVLWFVVLVKLLTPPLVSWPSLPASPQQVPRALVAQAPIPMPVEPEAPIEALDDFDAIWTEWEGRALPPVEPEPINLPERVAPSSLRPVALVREPAEEVKPVAAPAPVAKPAARPVLAISTAWLVPGLVGIWGLGALALAVRQGVRIARFSRRLKQARPAPDWLVDEVARIAGVMGIKAPQVLALPGLAVPMVWCLGRPVLLVPHALMQTLAGERWSGVLTHELAHLKRGDHWVARLELVAGLIWWWSPVYWVVHRQLNNLSELACDAWVVKCGPKAAERRRYAEALVDVCEHVALAHASVTLGVGVSGNAKALEGRLDMILRDSEPRPTPGRWALVAAVLILVSLPAWSPSQAPLQTKPAATPGPASSGSASAAAASSPSATPAVVPNPNATQPQSTPAAASAASVAKSTTADPSGRAFPLGPTLVLPPLGGKPADRSAGTEDIFTSGVIRAVDRRGSQVQNLSATTTVSVETRNHSGQAEQRNVSVRTAEMIATANEQVKVDTLATHYESDSDRLDVRTVAIRTPESQKVAREIVGGNQVKIIDLEFPDAIRVKSVYELESTDPQILFPGVWEGRPFPFGLPASNPKTQSVQGVSKIDGQETLCLAWTFAALNPVEDYKVRLWVAPALGFAPVRLECLRNYRGDNGVKTQSIKARYRDFQQVGGVQIARSVEIVDDGIGAGGQLVFRRRIRATIDDLKINEQIAADTFQTNRAESLAQVDEEGDGPSLTPLNRIISSEGSFKPTKISSDRLTRFKNAVEKCPFGRVDRLTTVGENPRTSPMLLGSQLASPALAAPTASDVLAQRTRLRSIQPIRNPLAVDPMIVGPNSAPVAIDPARPADVRRDFVVQSDPNSVDPAAVQPARPAPAASPVDDAAAVQPARPARAASPVDDAAAVQPARPAPAASPVDDAPAVPPARPAPVSPPVDDTAGFQPARPARAASPVDDAAAVQPARPAPVSPPVDDTAGFQPARTAPLAAPVTDENADPFHQGIRTPVQSTRPSPTRRAPRVNPEPIAPARALPTEELPAPTPAPNASAPAMRGVSAPTSVPAQAPAVQPAIASAPASAQRGVARAARPRLAAPAPASPGQGDRLRARNGEPEEVLPPAEGSANLDDQRDQIELMTARLEGKKAELEASATRLELATAKEKRLLAIQAKGSGFVDSGALEEVVGQRKIAAAQHQQTKADLTEAELRITQAKRRLGRDTARLRQDLEDLQYEIKQMEAVTPNSPERQGLIRKLRKLERAVKEAGPPSVN